jgi:HK97 family phage portal protein
MGLFGAQRREFFGISGAADLLPGRMGGGRAVGGQVVTDERANRHSVVWACTRLHAGLMSTFPIDQYRDIPLPGVGKVQTEIPNKPVILTDPGGTEMDIVDWLAASQVDLIQSGNAVGLIRERSALANRFHPRGLPTRIELQQASTCQFVKMKDRPPQWRIGGEWYDPSDVYHERTNVVAGLHVGLPTNLYAALSIGEGLAMQQYGTDWFASGGMPKSQMKNVAKRLNPVEIATAKQWYRDTVQNGDVLVTGADWEYDFLQAQTAGVEFIEGRAISNLAVCRFYDTPGDMVDVNSDGSSITYANITQRNLEFLILRLGPKVIAREKALSRLLPTPRYVKMNTDALLRMDPETRARVIKTQIETRVLTNPEARALDNRKPLTAADKAEFIEIYGTPKASPTSSVSIESSTGTASGGSQTGDDEGQGSDGVGEQ